ncbi:MAG: hypothetical protein DMF06_04745 [Verrucomicrobia bacterium]|nr:MAG: hypothetical protein DMF06_04745 [Verrucomicrobiota bacterium]
MKLQNRLTKAALLAGAFVVTALFSSVALADDYSFKVHNNTKDVITKLLVSEDGEKYGYFDIGDGIKPGETETLVWDKATNSQSCHQWFKAVWANGEEGKPVQFNFCEKDLTLEF